MKTQNMKNGVRSGNNPSKRILIVSHLFPPETGGVQRVAEKLATESTHDITVLASPTDNEGWDDRYDFPVHRHPLNGPRGLLTQLIMVFWLALRYRADVIYFTRPEYAFCAAPTRLLGCSVFSHTHGSELYANGSMLHKLYLTLSRLTIQKFIAISDWTRSRLVELGVSDHDITVIPNGVDADWYGGGDPDNVDVPVAPNSRILLTVGRLTHRKGHQYVIRALTDVGDDVEYLVVGPGNPSKLKAIAEQEGVVDRVHFLGKVPESKLPDYYAFADVFVMTPKFIEGDVEGFGLVYLEANAAGTPTVGTRIGGIPSAISDGRSGLLCDPTMPAIVNAINSIFEDVVFKSELEDGAREWANEHDWLKIIQKWDGVIASEP